MVDPDPRDQRATWRHGRGRLVLDVIACLLPDRLRRLIWRRCYKWEVARTARVGRSLFVGVDEVRIGEHVRIGAGNVFRNLRRIDVGAYVEIGQWNWISASPWLIDGPTQGEGRLTLGEHAAIVSRHYLDCSGGVEIGRFTTVAGVRSVLFTHQIDANSAEMTTGSIVIGAYCLISTGTTLVPGVRIPDRSVVAAGAVVVGAADNTNVVWGGVPARPLKPLPEAAFFNRTTGRVRPRAPEERAP